MLVVLDRQSLREPQSLYQASGQKKNQMMFDSHLGFDRNELAEKGSYHQDGCGIAL